MYIDQLNLEKAPQVGQLLVYPRTERIIFQEYASLSQVKEMLAGKEILEIHMFNDDMEYRAIASRSRRFARGKDEASGGIIEAVADFGEKPDEIYREDVRLEAEYSKKTDKTNQDDTETAAGFGSLTVLNHISYDNNGMATMDNYRLKMGGKSYE